MIKAVIIDFDDTLCLTEAACFELENDVLVRMGRDPMTREVHIETWGQPLFDAMLIRSPGIDIEAFKEAYHPAIAEYIRENRLDVIADENYAALDELVKRDKKLMILTSRTLGEVKHMLEPDHFLANPITGFYHKDNMRYHKPDPRAFDEVLADHSLEPNECAYIGDSVSDAIASKQAGLWFVASLESGLRQKEDFAKEEADYYIDKFSDITDVIKDLDTK